MTKKRIAIIRLLHYPQDKLVQREATALHQAGFDVDVYCIRDTQPAEEIIDSIHVHRVALQRKWGGAINNLIEYALFFFYVAFRLPWDHLHRPFAAIQVNTMPDFLVFATLIPRLLGVKVTLQMYEPMPELWATKFRSHWPIQLLKVIEQWGLRYVHAAFTVTQPIKDRFVSRGADAAKITVVLNVPDPNLFDPRPDPPPSENLFFTFLCHGAIEERYGHDTMLQAIAQVRSVVPNARLHITGEGGYEQEFVRQIQEMGLNDHVKFLGFVPFAQLVQELTQADVGIVAQKSSPYSNLVHTGKMYDFLAFGKPVIASRLDAVCAYFDETSICFFEPGNADDLARAMIEIYQNSENRQRMAHNAAELYEQYQWKHQREAYLAVYHALIPDTVTSS